jgi:hypothetical protein
MGRPKSFGREEVLEKRNSTLIYLAEVDQHQAQSAVNALRL